MDRRLRNALRIGAAVAAVPVAFMALVHVLVLVGRFQDGGTQSVVRFMKGEPGATQDVNDAADWLHSSGESDDLERFADELTLAFGPKAAELPKGFFGEPMIPITRLPEKFRRLGWHNVWKRPLPSNPKNGPECVLIQDETGAVTAVEIQWGHRRHVVIIFTKAPPHSPRGFHVRRVTQRIYIVANES